MIELEQEKLSYWQMIMWNREREGEINMKGEYRRIDSEEVCSFETLSELADNFKEIIEMDDFTQKIDDIESDVGDIIDSLKSFELKEALEKLEELKEKLY